MGHPGCTDVCASRCHMVLALQSGFGNFANQMPCSLLNFSGFSSVLQREVVKKRWKLEGNHLRAPLSSPRTFQIDVNKLKKTELTVLSRSSMWNLIFDNDYAKKKSSRTWQMILISWYRLFSWQLDMWNYKIKMNVIILLNSFKNTFYFFNMSVWICQLSVRLNYILL